MLGKLAKYFHHVFNPHCLDCAAEKRCSTCDSYKELLADERRRTNDLLDRLVENPNDTKILGPDEPKIEIKPRRKPWPVLRRELEEQDRLKAQNRTIDETILANKRTTEELERELDINNG